MSAPTDKLLVFLTEGPEGWDTPIGDLVAACGDIGQPAMPIDLTKPDASAQLNKAASAGITAFVSMEGIGSRMMANGRSIFELLQAPLLTFLPDHPCFYAPLLTTPQKLVVPIFFSQEHVTAARGIFGNVPLAPVIEPWGPRTLELEGEPVTAVFVDASMFEVAKSLDGQHERTRELVAAIEAAIAAGAPDVHSAYAQVLDARWIPAAGVATPKRVRLFQWAIARRRAEQISRFVDASGIAHAHGAGFPTANAPSLKPLPVGVRPSFEGTLVDAMVEGTDALRRARVRARFEARTDSGDSRIAPLLRAAQSSLFLDIAVAGIR